MIKCGIIGGAGYMAGELIRLLLNHPDAELTFINTGHYIHCTEFGYNTFFVTDKSFGSFIFMELFIGRVMNNLFDVSYAVLC